LKLNYDKLLSNFAFKFNLRRYDSVNFPDTRHWLRDDWTVPGAVSSRAANAAHAPADLVWRPEDFQKLDALT
jgi:hypothetical protein